MSEVPLFMPGCCTAGNSGVYWIVKDEGQPNGNGCTGWDGFHGWGMSCDGPGFFEIKFCPWCGYKLSSPYHNEYRKHVPMDTAICISQEWLKDDVAKREARTAELRDR